MVLKVNLQCPCCYKKIKKILCKFPQIRDQAFDEKQNTVTITVVCCSPEEIRGKLRCMGGKTIQCIEIPPPPPPPPPPVPSPSPPPPPPPIVVCLDICCHGCERPKPCHCGCGGSTTCPGPKPQPCHCGCGGSTPCPGPKPQPCHCGCGGSTPCCGPPPQPQPCHCGCGRPAPCSDRYYGKPCATSVYYFTDENPSACTIM